VWRSLLVLGVSKTQHISGILQNDVLEAPAMSRSGIRLWRAIRMGDKAPSMLL